MPMGMGLGGFALGAAVTYWLDPQRGASRRAGVKQKALHAAREASEAAEIAARDLAHRSRGLISKASERFTDTRDRIRGQNEDDAILTERVRARLGHVCSHPGAIMVTSHDGRVELKGPILQSEVKQVLRAVRRVRGVREIDDDLEVHESAGNIPSLQGGIDLANQHRQHWAPATRTLAGAAGVGLLSWAVRRRSFLRTGLGLAGLSLIIRSITNRPAGHLMSDGKFDQLIPGSNQRRTNMRCEEIMKRAVEGVTPQDTVQNAARRMRDENIGFLPVCDESTVVLGTVTDRDLTIRVLAEGKSPDIILDEVFTRELIACRPQDDVSRAQELMAKHQKSRIVCTDEQGHLVGIISLSDIVQILPEGQSSKTLREISDREARA
jgi:CBS domain-containing protein